MSYIDVEDLEGWTFIGSIDAREIDDYKHPKGAWEQIEVALDEKMQMRNQQND